MPDHNKLNNRDFHISYVMFKNKTLYNKQSLLKQFQYHNLKIRIFSGEDLAVQRITIPRSMVETLKKIAQVKPICQRNSLWINPTKIVLSSKGDGRGPGIIYSYLPKNQ
ncbi:hypothetical protein GCM10009119_35500 [Algoriphagus jejuensis]|uniref:Uncharacterized protein n=1 Tax=Algoriphagus jejuensis TaxID=419934 RepID=A0ABP3YGX3_9BACT